MNARISFMLGIAAAAMLAAGAASAAEINGDTFRITLPVQFGEPVKTTATKDKIETTTWVSKAGQTGEAVVISVSKMPAKIADAAKLMDSTRDSLLKSVNGTMENEQPIAGDNPARSLMFHSGTAAFLRARLAVSGDRLYDVLYVGRSEDQRALPSIGQIFDSFQIAPAAASAPAPAPAPAPSGR